MLLVMNSLFKCFNATWPW